MIKVTNKIDTKPDGTKIGIITSIYPDGMEVSCICRADNIEEKQYEIDSHKELLDILMQLKDFHVEYMTKNRFK